MYLLQQLTHKVPTRYPILKYAKKWISPNQFSVKYKINQPLVAQTMRILYNEGQLERKTCDCGKGFLYQVLN